MNVRSESIGSTLAEARRSAGLTVGQLSCRTKIREALIHAIERDDFSLCGGDFYVRGHIRNIAKAVGLDPEAMVHAYDESHGGGPAPVRAASVFQANSAIKFRDRRSPNWTMALAIALAIVVIFGVVRVMGGTGDDRMAEERTGPVPKHTSQAEGAPRRAASVDESKKKAEERARRAKTVTVRVTARERSFVRVRDAAGRRLFAGRLDAGKVSTWESTTPLKVTVGNAGGVSISVNGKDVGSLGRPGERVTRIFEADKP
ncbi:helix-turn-helix domain-containing protein [Streptosporangium sp. KLBMP 9127]|nr:DUF4115 domain-containing protein [Streptosporangium sp. KLBMP 9127]